MRHPARGSAQAGIDGKSIAASRRISRRGRHEPPARHLGTLGKRFLPGLLVLAMVGCGAVPQKEDSAKERWYETMVEPLQSEPERALRFYDRIIRLKGAELARELEAARQAYDRDRSELARVELAMILSLPGAPFRDDHAAAQLLQPFAKDPGLEQSALRPLALLLGAQLAENRKHEEAWQQQAAKAKEEQRKADDLQQKLDALLDMEKKLIEREQSIPTKKK